jgi:hypothetical protein
MARDPGRHTVTLQPAPGGARENGLLCPIDQLADPDSDRLIGAALTLWPQGAPGARRMARRWISARGLARFTRVMIDGFVRLYRQAYLFAREATVTGVDQLLPEWEADYGLPDICDMPARRRPSVSTGWPPR